MAFIFNRSETRVDKDVQRVSYTPVWYDGMCLMDYIKAEKNLMQRAGVLTDDNAPREPTAVEFNVYTAASLSDYVGGTFVFEIKLPAAKSYIVRFTANFDTMSKTRFDYVANEMFKEILENSWYDADTASSNISARAMAIN